ncbi:hypothetical protein ABSA28_00213 [Candidatus Hepatincolaceae symbiont of Richtersius coronifer]
MKKFQDIKLLNKISVEEELFLNDLTNKSDVLDMQKQPNPNEHLQVRMLMEPYDDSEGAAFEDTPAYRLSEHYAVDQDNGTININYFLPFSLNLLEIPDLSPQSPHLGISVRFQTIVTEVMASITNQLRQVNVPIRFNSVNDPSAADLRIIAAPQDPNNPIYDLMYTVPRQINDPEPATITINLSDELYRHLNDIYRNQAQSFSNPRIESVYRESLRATFYHEMGHVLGLDHPLEASDPYGETQIIISRDNPHQTYGVPLMISAEEDYISYMAPTLLNQSSIGFSPQELTALSQANPMRLAIMLPVCTYSRNYSTCKPLYIADGRSPAEIFSNSKGFRAILYGEEMASSLHNLTSEINKSLAIKEEGLNEHLFGYSIKSKESKYIMTSGNLNKLLEALSSLNFTDGSPIYVYETYPQYAYDPKKYYEQFLDKDTILPKFEGFFIYEPYICLNYIKLEEINRGIRYEYLEGKYKEINSTKNSHFVKKPQVLDSIFPGTINNWEYDKAYKINDVVPLGLSPNAHAGGKGAGSAFNRPDLIDIGKYGPYSGIVYPASTGTNEHLTIKFKYNNHEVGELQYNSWPLTLSSAGGIIEDMYFNHPISVVTKNKWQGANITMYVNAPNFNDSTLAINTIGAVMPRKSVSLPSEKKIVKMFSTSFSDKPRDIYRFNEQYPKGRYGPIIKYTIDENIKNLFFKETQGKDFTVDFEEIVSEVFHSISEDLSSELGIRIEFSYITSPLPNMKDINLVIAKQGSSLLGEFSREDLGDAIMRTVPINLSLYGRQPTDRSRIIFNRKNDAIKELVEYAYLHYGFKFAQPLNINIIYKELIRAMFYHEMGHILGLAHPEMIGVNTDIPLIMVDENEQDIQYKTPLMMATSLDLLAFSLGQLNVNTIKFSPQELEALSRMHKYPPVKVAMTTSGAPCKFVYLVDGKAPNMKSEYSLVSSGVTSEGVPWAGATDNFNDNFLGSSVNIRSSSLLLASGELQDAVKAINSKNFTDYRPIYIYEVAPEESFDVKGCYEQFSDSRIILNNFNKVYNVFSVIKKPFMLNKGVKKNTLFRVIKYVYRPIEKQYIELKQDPNVTYNQFFTINSQNIRSDYPSSKFNWLMRQDIYYINNIPLGFSIAAHLGGEGSGSAYIEHQQLGSYGYYKTTSSYGGFIGGAVTVKFYEQSNYIGDFYGSFAPVMGFGVGGGNDTAAWIPISELVRQGRSRIHFRFMVLTLYVRLDFDTEGLIDGGINLGGAGLGGGMGGGVHGYFHGG